MSDQRALADEAAVHVVRAARMLERRARDWLEGTGMDPSGFRLVVELHLLEVASVHELARAAGRHQSTVSRQVAALAAAGLVSVEADATDRRRQNVRLTPQGKKAFALVRRRRSEELVQRMEDFSEDEYRQLAQLLQRFAAGEGDDFGALEGA